MSRLAPHRLALSLVAVLSLAGVFLACDDDETPSSPAPAPSQDAGSVTCASDPRVTPFATGVKAQSISGNLVVELVSASPSPPQRGAGDAGMNTWQVRITVGGQAPAPETITVKTLMPDHGHGSPKVPVLTPNGDGTFAMTDLFLFMGGVWEISFAQSTQEVAKFTFCVD